MPCTANIDAVHRRCHRAAVSIGSTVPVANTFTLHEAAAAHAASQTGHVAGRTVIVVVN
jgi:hypothetical protein